MYLQKSKEASLGRHICGDQLVEGRERARAGSSMYLEAMVDVLAIRRSYFGFTTES